jgi:phenylpyruvate tautomerase PptA (4-oxalocrotonate tautomerase family)
VSLDVFAGRTLEAKRSLYRGIVENLESLGIPRDHVKILLREIPREDWGIRGGQAGSDIDLGFDRGLRDRRLLEARPDAAGPESFKKHSGMLAHSAESRSAMICESSPRWPGRLRGGRRILLVGDFSITHMTWNPFGDHHHPTDVTYVKPDGSEETTAPDQLPFAIEGDVDVEGIGVVVRSGLCTRCGQRLMPGPKG